MIGITPAELMPERDEVLRRLAHAGPAPCVRCGIWISTRRAATVIATVTADDRHHDDAEEHEQRERADRAASSRSSNVCTMPGQIRSTIEKKIIRHAPLPRPRSVICSPSHMTNIAPVVRTNAIWSAEAEARVGHRARQRLGEDREAPRLHRREADGERSASTA